METWYIFSVLVIICTAVCVVGYVLYIMIALVRASNDAGAENSIEEFSKDGFVDFYFDPNVDPTITLGDPAWALSEEEQKKLERGGWYCAKCQKLNAGTTYVCSCGLTKKDSEEMQESD